MVLFCLIFATHNSHVHSRCMFVTLAFIKLVAELAKSCFAHSWLVQVMTVTETHFFLHFFLEFKSCGDFAFATSKFLRFIHPIHNIVANIYITVSTEWRTKEQYKRISRIFRDKEDDMKRDKIWKVKRRYYFPWKDLVLNAYRVEAYVS